MRVFILEKPGKCLDQMLDLLGEYGETLEIKVFENDIWFVEQVSNHNPELCIIRAGWNGLPGLRVAEIVKQINPNLKIVILSETKDYALEAYEIGVHGYLLCPLDKKKLKNIIFSGSDNLQKIKE